MNSKSKYLIIANPNAGSRKLKSDWKLIETELDKYDLDYKLIFTTKPKEAIKLTSENINEEYKNIIAVGGDGTINEVVNGIFSQQKVNTEEICLGSILIGTGNDWGRMFKIPKGYAESVKTIVKGKTFLQDAGIVSFFNGNEKIKRYFINAAGLGFDAYVTKSTNIKKESGKSSVLSYISSLLKSLFKYRSMNAKIDVIDKGEFHNGKLFTLSIGIGKYTGGGMKQTPDAIADDGLFDLMLVEKITKAKLIRKLPKLYNGKINKLNEVKTLQTSKLQIESDSKLLIQIDGESVGHGPFEFDILPKALRIIVN